LSVLSTRCNKLWEEGLHEILRQLHDLLYYFENDNEHVIRGASIFIVVCPVYHVYKVKLIDLCSMESFSEAHEEGFNSVTRDPGLIHGVRNLINFFKQAV